MAIYNLDNYETKDGFGMSLNIRRGNPNPLDNSSVWESYDKAHTYAQTDPTAYVGQILTVTNGQTSTAYIIENENGDLKEVGGNIEIDSALSDTSTNPVQNKVVKAALDGKNAFSKVAIGSTTIAADSTTDTLTFVAGANITLTPDTTNDKVTIAATGIVDAYTKTEADNKYQTKIDENLTTTNTDKTIVGAINELNDSKLSRAGDEMAGTLTIKQGGVGIQLGTAGNICATDKYNGGGASRTVFGVGLNWATDKETEDEATFGHPAFQAVLRGSETRPVYVQGGMSTSKVINDMALLSDIPDISNLQAQINELSGKTVDKITTLNLSETVADIDTDASSDEGRIIYAADFSLCNSSGEDLASGTVNHTLPIAAGNNIDFEFDESNHVVKINATGGSSESVDLSGYQTKNDSTLATTDKTVVGAIKELNDGKLSLVGGEMDGTIDMTRVRNPFDFGTQGWIRGMTTSGGRFDIFGYSNPSTLQVGGTYPALELRGKNTRPTYNGSNMALLSDIPNGLPSYSYADSGKVLMIVSGTPKWMALPGFITFSVGNGTYVATEDMTWTQWCSSSANTDGYYVEGGSIYDSSGEYYIIDNYESSVSASSKIMANYSYDTFSVE